MSDIPPPVDFVEMETRGRQQKNNKRTTTETDEKEDEKCLQKFKFVLEYEAEDKFVLLPYKKPKPAHAGESPLDLTTKPKPKSSPTNTVESDDEPLDLSINKKAKK